MTLDQWIIQNGLTEAQAGARIGVAQAAVNKYRRHLRTPRPAIMRRIVEVTDGQVTPNDFLDPPVRAPSPEEIAA